MRHNHFYRTILGASNLKLLFRRDLWCTIPLRLIEINIFRYCWHLDDKVRMTNCSRQWCLPYAQLLEYGLEMKCYLSLKLHPTQNYRMEHILCSTIDLKTRWHLILIYILRCAEIVIVHLSLSFQQAPLLVWAMLLKDWYWT